MHAIAQALEHSPMEWSVVVRDVETGAAILDQDGSRVVRAASMGKLILLAFAGNVILDDPESGKVRLDRRAVAPVSDSGIWQHLDIDQLSVADILDLVFMASDNLATNVLLDHFGLERVRGFRPAVGLSHTDLLDIVRDRRGPDDPETLSRATAVELCSFMTRVARSELVTPSLSGWLRRGLSLGMDLSMVPSPLGLDPLARVDAHAPGDALAANKTGTDAGIRADAGIIGLGAREVAYAVICNYDHAAIRDIEAIRLMRAIGEAIVDQCRPT